MCSTVLSMEALINKPRSYVEKMPPAISGSGGHDALFRVACVLTNGFALSDEQAWSILQEYNARCQPPWSQRELPHKLSEVRKVSHLKSLGHLLSEGGKITPQSSSPPRVLGRITLPDTAEGDPEPLTAYEQPLVADEAEARRIAAELGNLHRDGAISGPDDPDARLFAAVIHTKLGKPSWSWDGGKVFCESWRSSAGDPFQEANPARSRSPFFLLN